MKKFRDQFAPLKPNFTITEIEEVINGKETKSKLELFGGLYEEATKARGLMFDPFTATYVIEGDNKKVLGLYLGEIWDSEPMLIQLRDQMPMFKNEITV